MRYFLILCLFSFQFLQGKIEHYSKEESHKENAEIAQLKELLKQKYATISEDAEEDHQEKLLEIQEIRREIHALEEAWQKRYSEKNIFEEEGSGIWDPGELSLSELIMEYASADYLYVIPPEIFHAKLQIFSGIPIPRNAWDQMIKVILHSNGIGVRQINPYAKKLYLLKQNLSMIDALCQNTEDLLFVENGKRVAYIFAPEPEQTRALHSFFEKFSDPKETSIQIVGRKIVLVAMKESVEKLLSLYNAIWEKNSEKIVRVVNIQKMNIPSAEKILKAFFPQPTFKGRIPIYSHLSDELIFLSAPQGLVLVGNRHVIEKAEKVLEDLEDQLEDPYEMTVYWYNCKHSNPEDVSEVLSQVYDSLLQTSGPKNAAKAASGKKLPKHISPSKESSSSFSMDGNFIVDPKSGSILMVVRKDQLPKIKELLQKIDIPKKMVQIDVLLVEKRMQDNAKTGINLLKLGSNALRSDRFLQFDAGKTGGGLLDFVFAKEKGSSLPGIDLTFNFLMAQKDMKINANPSVLAVNQTTAMISIVEEISLNNGAVILDPSSTNPRSETSFTRAQYGTILKMTPTIHYSGEESEQGFITLLTDITFDTTQNSLDDRPPVIKRSVKNEVTVADGETIILGGLRRMTTESSEEKIPFLGDIPGIGKFFGMNTESHQNTEMFIFITPKIIKHPIEDLRKIRAKELQKRAGDLPEFLEKISEAKAKEKQKVLEASFDLIFSKAA